MKVKREQVLNIFGILQSLSNEKVSPRGAYNIAKNKQLAEIELKVYQEAQKQAKTPEGIIKFEEKRLQLCEESAEKDEEKKAKKIDILNPMTGRLEKNQDGSTKQMFDITEENRTVLQKTLDELAETEFKEAFEERDKIEEGFKKLLEEEIDMSFVKIKIDDLPSKITPTEIETLEVLLEVE